MCYNCVFSAIENCLPRSFSEIVSREGTPISDKYELFGVTFKDVIMDFKCCEDNEMKLLEVIKIDTMIKPRL